MCKHNLIVLTRCTFFQIPLGTPVEITEDHRIGVFFRVDPGPLRLQEGDILSSSFAMMLSDEQFPTEDELAPAMDHIYSFANSIVLSYTFADLFFCNTSGIIEYYNMKLYY